MTTDKGRETNCAACQRQWSQGAFYARSCSGDNSASPQARQKRKNAPRPWARSPRRLAQPVGSSSMDPPAGRRSKGPSKNTSLLGCRPAGKSPRWASSSKLLFWQCIWLSRWAQSAEPHPARSGAIAPKSIPPICHPPLPPPGRREALPAAEHARAPDPDDTSCKELYVFGTLQE